MINLNIELPEGFLNEENRDGYIVSKEMKEVWAVELDILNKIQEVCKKNNIQILGAGGTLLGAVRHHGMIPWDDDIDLDITRENYNKLCAVAEKEFEYPYFFQTEYSDRGSYRGHAQVRRSDTTGMLVYETEKNINQGIFVDIFPFDNVPDKKITRRIFFKMIRINRQIYQKIDIYSNYALLCKGNSKIRIAVKKICYPFAVVLKKLNADLFFYKLMEKNAQIYNNKFTKYKGCVSFKPDEKLWCSAGYFDESLMVPFEFLTIAISKKYVEKLKRQYGDYNKFVIGKSYHGEVIFDTDKSYKEYQKLYK